VSVAATYAEALYEAASDRGVVQRVSDDLHAFLSAIDETPELARVLGAPEIDTRAKKAAVGQILADADPTVRSFVLVLLDRGRVDALGEIAAAFDERVSQAEGRIRVQAVTAVPLTDDLRARIVARVREQTGREPELTERVDPEIIGGLMLRVGGVVVDGSVRSRLGTLRRSLETTALEPAAAGPA
jgi:F-type H+-transporting ATPase subunit delta